MTDPILSVRTLSRKHGTTPVLDKIDLTVAPGEFVILIGGSGSGKSTLLRTVGGLEHADAGQVLLRGVAVDDPAKRLFVPPEQRGLGMVFQDYALWPHMTAQENVPAALPGRQHDRERTARGGATADSDAAVSAAITSFSIQRRTDDMMIDWGGARCPVS